MRQNEDEHPVRLLAPAELDDRVPAGGRAVDCCAAAAATSYHPGTRGEATFAGAAAAARAPRRRRAPPNLRRARSVVGGRAAGGRAALRMAIGDAAPHGGTFFFFRSEMDPLNTLWLAPVGSAMALFRDQQGSLVAVMPRESAGLPPGVRASRRRLLSLARGLHRLLRRSADIASVLRPLAS